MRRRQAHVHRCLLCTAVLVATLAAGAHAERLPLKAYSTEDGLPHNTVNCIVKDSRGFLWFCTADGLSRFDGYAFTNFGIEQGLPHAWVNDFLETRAGEYWLATRGGLIRFEPKGAPDRHPGPGNTRGAAAPMFTLVFPDGEGLRAHATTVLREGHDGTIWAGTWSGLYRVEHTEGRYALRPVEIGLPKDAPEQSEIADMLEDPAGSLWVAAPSGLYRRWPDGSAARYTERDGLPTEALSDLFEDRHGRLWAATRDRGIFRIRPDSSRGVPVFDPPLIEGLSTAWVFQLHETSDGRFWAATNKGQAQSMLPGEPRGGGFRAYTSTNGLSHFEVTALSEDMAGNLWLGTIAAGAMKLTRGGFTTYGQSDWIRTVNAAFDDGNTGVCFRGWILGDAQTTVFDQAKLDVLHTEQTDSHQRFGCLDGQRFNWFIPEAVRNFGWVTERVTLRARSGEWWIGAGDGLYRFPSVDNLADLKTARPLSVYAGPQVFRLFEDSGGNVWSSSVSPAARILARWDRLTGRVRDLGTAPGLSSLHHDWPARSFVEDPHGYVWVGFDGELARYKGGAFTLFTAADGVPPGPIRDMHVDRAGRLWLASSQGLTRVDDGASARPAFASYTTRQGLSSNNLEVIAADAFGHIYVGGGHGLDRLDPATGRVKHFTAADGLLPGLLRFGFRDRQGVLWFGTSHGLARVVSARDHPPAPPPVLISGLRVRGVTQRVSALGEQQMSLPDFAPRQNQLEIDYLGLGFGSGEVLRYQHRLDGADAEWSALTLQRTVTYASLAPGRYTFIVRAVNSDGLVSDLPASVSFRILRPLWQQWWFVTLIAMALGLAAHAAFRYRLNRLLEVAQMRAHIATDLHDDIGANLTRIALLSEVAGRIRQEESLSSIARIARESVGSMSDIVWAINPKRESLLDLTRRMRQHADEVFTSRGIALRFDAPAGEGVLKLNMDVRRDLLLIFKEAVNNAARHSRASAVEIEMRVEGSGLVLVVSDNGDGFDVPSAIEGNGLTSMHRRARRINGTLEIASNAGTGARVTLVVPV